MRGTALGEALTAGGCHPASAVEYADGLLYLGPASSLTLSPEHPDIYLDEAFRQEASRRLQILEGEPLPSPVDMRAHPTTAVKVRP